MDSAEREFLKENRNIFKLDCEFLRENKNLFRLFRWSGILIETTNRSKLKWSCALFASRICWFMWHLLGTVLSIWSRQGFTTNFTELNIHFTQESILQQNIYVYVPFILLLLLFLGPIQDTIIKRNMQSFPKILKNIQKLERMEIANCEISDEEENNQLSQNSDLDSAEKGKQGNIIYQCYAKCWLPHNISAVIFILLILISLFLVTYKMHDIDDFWNEWKLFAVMFYLPLPLLTTLFVTTLIKQINKLYTAISKLKDNMFTESENIEKVSNYLSLLQETVAIMMDNIFEFTLGINFAIFVSSAVVCSYELVEALKTAKKEVAEDGIVHRQLANNLADVDYIIPLFMCVLPMLWICKVSDNIMSNVHTKIRLRIRGLLPKLYLSHKTREGWSDKPFKKLEFLYKTLKEWPPQVYIYGGWKVSYQLLSAIILFIFTYSLKIYSF